MKNNNKQKSLIILSIYFNKNLLTYLIHRKLIKLKI